MYNSTQKVESLVGETNILQSVASTSDRGYLGDYYESTLREMADKASIVELDAGLNIDCTKKSGW